MVDLLEKKPDLAKSYHNRLHKVNIKEEWNKIANKLNPLGPPFRLGSEWMKVWADYKCNLKKKLVHNKAESRATGGGLNKQHIFSATEEAACGLLQLNTIINPEGVVFGIPQNFPKGHQYIDDDVDMNENEENIAPSTSQINKKKSTQKVTEKIDLIEHDVVIIDNEKIIGPCTSQTNKKGSNKKVNDKIDLVEQQLQVQTDLYNEVKESLKQIERYSRKQHKIKEEKLKLYKSEQKRKEEKYKLYKSELKKKDEHRKLLLNLRKDEIEIQTRRIELEEWKHGIKK